MITIIAAMRKAAVHAMPYSRASYALKTSFFIWAAVPA
jgi:hypothetical protein